VKVATAAQRSTLLEQSLLETGFGQLGREEEDSACWLTLTWSDRLATHTLASKKKALLVAVKKGIVYYRRTANAGRQ
jgi:hypothetical protein